MLSQRNRAMLRLCLLTSLQYVDRKFCYRFNTAYTVLSSSQSCMLQAVINIDSLIRHSRCTADRRSHCSQVQHVIDR